jgi:RNA polymerase sigma-70 factor (ECF subfamily)
MATSRPAPPRDPAAAADALEHHRTELTGYCYRMLGSVFEAEDAVQETMARAWRALDRFEGRSGLRTWLYRIASNVCFDMLAAGRRRALPMDLGPAGTVEGPIGGTLPESAWVLPAPDGLVLGAGGADPADEAVARESIRLAFVAVLQALPPRQRAVLILREVLRMDAREVAALLETTVASVNSALQRARATLAGAGVRPDGPPRPEDPAQRELLDRYMDAFERYDIPALTALLREDAQQSMPPYELWLRGRDDILAWWTGPGAGCRGSRLIPTVANGRPAFGQYRAAPDGGHRPWALQVLEPGDDGIAGFTFFLDTGRLFPLFGLPAHLPPR